MLPVSATLKSVGIVEGALDYGTSVAGFVVGKPVIEDLSGRVNGITSRIIILPLG
jgi:hypothetical protein